MSKHLLLQQTLTSVRVASMLELRHFLIIVCRLSSHQDFLVVVSCCRSGLQVVAAYVLYPEVSKHCKPASTWSI